MIWNVKMTISQDDLSFLKYDIIYEVWTVSPPSADGRNLVISWFTWVYLMWANKSLYMYQLSEAGIQVWLTSLIFLCFSKLNIYGQTHSLLNINGLYVVDKREKV